MKIRTIAVAVDASPHSLAALTAAAALASRQGAELTGVFVEDTDLLRLAGLPFAREMFYPAALGQPIDPHFMADRLRALADEAHEAVSREALRARVSWSFQVRRGWVLEQLREAATDADLLVIGRASHQEKSRRVRLGTTAARLLAEGTRPVMALQFSEGCTGPALVVCDGSPTSIKRLAPALEWAEIFGDSPVVLLLAQTRAEAEFLKEKVRGGPGLADLQFRRCSATEPHGLARIAHEEATGVVVFAGRPLLPPEEIPDLLEDVDCPVLLSP